MTENKIYTSWAFSEDYVEKSNSNRKALEELKQKYNITSSFNYERMSDEEKENVDIVFNRSGSGYGSSIYKIYKNKPELSKLELALICDDGNLCFGYSLTGENLIAIYID